MKKPKIDDQNINDYIDQLILENDELKIELGESKRKRSLEKEYKELISDILSACKETHKKHELDENEISEFTFLVITYINNFSGSYKIYF